MPTSTPRADRNERLSALRRQMILDAAQRVFERDGLEKTTIRAITKEAGCTTGAIYPWFAGKEILYGALLDESLQRLHAHLQAATADCAPPLPRRARPSWPSSATTPSAAPISHSGCTCSRAWGRAAWAATWTNS